MPDFTISEIVVLTLWAENIPAAVNFYHNVLGLEPLATPGHGHQPHFKLNRATLVINQGQPHEAENAKPDRFPLFALAVNDLDKLVGQLSTHEIPLPWGIEGQSPRKYVMFHDPAGNLIELVQGHL
ncbi:MAG: VOC family protein [Chloroflexi bacterium]|nr:VOC family protein [Chloroflexota bacterium]